MSSKKPFLHICRDGKRVDVHGVSENHDKMGDEHLKSTILIIQQKAKNGFVTFSRGRKVVLFGEQAENALNLKIYLNEFKNRNLQW